VEVGFEESNESFTFSSVPCQRGTSVWEVPNIRLNKWRMDYTAQVVWQFVNWLFGIVLLLLDADPFTLIHQEFPLFLDSSFTVGAREKNKNCIHKFSLTQEKLIYKLSFLWVKYSFNNGVFNVLKCRMKSFSIYEKTLVIASFTPVEVIVTSYNKSWSVVAIWGFFYSCRTGTIAELKHWNLRPFHPLHITRQAWETTTHVKRVSSHCSAPKIVSSNQRKQ